MCELERAQRARVLYIVLIQPDAQGTSGKHLPPCSGETLRGTLAKTTFPLFRFFLFGGYRLWLPFWIHFGMFFMFVAFDL